MGVDTKLYLNTKWELNNIIELIEYIKGEKIEVISNHSFAPGYFCFNLSKRMIHVHTYTHTPLGEATLLDMHSDDESHELFKKIAETLGGIYIENDCDDKCEMMQGRTWDENGLQYFLKYAIVHDDIADDDIEGFLKSMNKWYDNTTSCTKPEFFKKMFDK